MFLTQMWVIDFVIWIIKLCNLLDYLTSCNIDWCGGFAINCTCCNYSDYTTIYLRISSQRKRSHCSSFIYYTTNYIVLAPPKCKNEPSLPISL